MKKLTGNNIIGSNESLCSCVLMTERHIKHANRKTDRQTDRQTDKHVSHCCLPMVCLRLKSSEW